MFSIGVFAYDCRKDKQCSNKEASNKWLFVYYMPYDNNLLEYAGQIIKVVSDSIQSTNVIAAMQADCDAKAGIYRYLIASDLTY